MEWIETMNDFGRHKIPFLFILDFELKNPVIFKLGELNDHIYYKINNIKNYTLSGKKVKPLLFETIPMEFYDYASAFDRVLKEIQFGNSFLLNLTFPTEIFTNYSLKELFDISHAKYKLYYKDQFIVSSPETFIQTRANKIFTYPMKGTIDASLENAESTIMNDQKELAEHYTIVDLLRNDLSRVAKNVKVNQFRYLDFLQTNSKKLIQVSSEIEGTLPENFHSNLGNIFNNLLPAGSISGAPKKKTLEIIKENEKGPRGFYTGVFGIFDGQNIDSAVMIRYIEKSEGKFWYRSGCGITNLSDCASEYKEMIDKVYVPVGRKY